MRGLGPGPWGVYVHVPWCRRRCPYCSFYVEVDRGADHGDYTAGVLADLEHFRPIFDDLGPPSTVFFGGGTPSRLPPDHLARIIAAIGPDDDAEISLEANPEDLQPRTLADLRHAGITRLSVGLQTFQPAQARLLNRASTVSQSRTALGAVADAGFDSFSVDLIFAVPGQTLDQLRADLDELAALDPPHVSLYGLTFEPGTPFERARDRGRLKAIDDGTWRAMADLIAERLGAMGLERYEISNFAKRGHESRHNQLYWTDRPYLGLGPSAHSYGPDGARWSRPADLRAWRHQPAEAAQRPTAAQSAADLIISALRGRQGLDLDRLHDRTGLRVDPITIAGLQRGSLVTHHQGRLRLRPAGIAVADGIAEKLIDSLQPAE